jgi:hypothetical protein
MTSKERIIAAWRGEPHDHVPFTTWSFGFQPPEHLRWRRDGREVKHWFTKRLEHIHTLPEPWELEDDFQRVLAWQSIGVDDVLDVSVPWSIDPDVTWIDSRAEAGVWDRQYPVLTREYQTPSGTLRHAVKKTPEDGGPGWVIQPDILPLFEDFNVPRGAKHAVTEPGEIDAVKHLYRPPSQNDCRWFEDRMRQVKAFADLHGVPVQAWGAFGMDALVWITGVQGAVYMSVDHPEDFRRLLDQITETDCARTELAAKHPGVDMVVERGWYASTDFWSPKLLDKFLFPHIATLAKVAHDHGKSYGYVMTTGINALGKRLVDAGVDVLYFIDPFADRITLEEARDQLSDRMTLVGGISSLTLSASKPEIEANVRHAMDVLGKTNRFILHPADSIFPDTSWVGLETLINTWKILQR